LETGLNNIAVAALVSIAHAPDESIDFLATTLRRSHSTVVRLVGSLVDQGLVSRNAGVDARVVSLDLTKAGKQMARKALASRTQVLDGLLAKLDRKERDTLESLSRKLIVSNVESEAEAMWICRLCDGEHCDPCPMVAVFGDD
jgi:DNA-binding MarR family transcriptional regulator